MTGTQSTSVLIVIERIILVLTENRKTSVK